MWFHFSYLLVFVSIHAQIISLAIHKLVVLVKVLVFFWLQLAILALTDDVGWIFVDLISLKVNL